MQNFMQKRLVNDLIQKPFSMETFQFYGTTVLTKTLDR